MTAPTCVVCERPTPDGYACPACTGRAAAQLAEIADLAPAARDIAYGLSATQSGAGGAGVPGPRFPINTAAMARLDALDHVLTRWVDHIGTQRGTTRPWFTHHGDRITTAATWLTQHLEWIRHQPHQDGNAWSASNFLTDVEAAARVMRGIVRGPSERKYLGPCGAIHAGPDPLEDGIDFVSDPCEGDVYGRPGADTGTCRTCGAQVDQAERRAWLDGLTRDRAYRASEIEDAHGVKAHTIRMWADRDLIAVHDRDHIGRKRYLLGEVLDQAAAMAERRAEREAKRAAREAQTEGATA